MKNKVLLILLSLSIISSLELSAQGIPDFKKSIQNFGRIADDQGKINHEFKFLNKGNGVLIIDSVKTSCSCIGIGDFVNQVEQGQFGEIPITLNPAGLSGTVQKNINVYFNGIEIPTRLRTIAIVSAGITNPKAYYKKKIGATRFKSNYLSFGRVYKDSIITKEFDVYNDSDTIVTFFDQIGKPDHIDIKIEPMSLDSGETGKIIVKYDASMGVNYGPNSEIVTLSTDENNRNAIKYLNISADIRFYFPKLSEKEKLESSNIKFDTEKHNFGKIIEGEIVTYKFKFRNTGKSDLEIIHTKTSCGCTAVAPEKDVYKPGEIGYLEVNFNSRNREGNQNKNITVFTNSPLSPNINLLITAEVAKDLPEAD